MEGLIVATLIGLILWWVVTRGHMHLPRWR